MYQNTGTGYEKAGLERMYQGKGRKVVYENDRSSGNHNSYNYYKGLRESDANDFDREWDNAAQKLGLYSDVRSLPYGAGAGATKQYQRSNTGGNYGGGYGGYDDYMDERRRGHFIADGLKGQDMPVRANQPHVERLMPVDTSHRMDIPHNRPVQDGDAPLALPSNANRAQANRAAPRNLNAGNVNARAPNRGRKQARIG